VDIIKSGGYKLSAPGIESALLAHERIAECAVLGLPDEALGEAVAAVIACAAGQQKLTLEELQAWAAERLPAYQVPRVLRVVDAIPHNAMGKVNKKQLKLDLFGG
jgi:malonyl-CoA/methylmalonyl-CoA synthetase